MTGARSHSKAYYYRLGDGGVPVACSPAEWSTWFVKSHKERTVARDEIGTTHAVSTMFLSLWNGDDAQGNPILWETIVYGRTDDEIEDCLSRMVIQYASLDAAKVGHELVVARLRDTIARAEASKPAPSEAS